MLSCSFSEVVLLYPSLDLLYTVVLPCNLILTQNITLSNPCLIYNIVILCSLIICKMAANAAAKILVVYVHAFDNMISHVCLKINHTDYGTVNLVQLNECLVLIFS